MCPKGESPNGSGLTEIVFLGEPASAVKGKVLYEEKCTVCYGKNGEGIMSVEGKAWTYPPLWGKDSYNDGAGLFRLSRFAGYMKSNMPLSATYNEPQLTNEEAWHLAALLARWQGLKKILRMTGLMFQKSQLAIRLGRSLMALMNSNISRAPLNQFRKNEKS